MRHHQVLHQLQLQIQQQRQVWTVLVFVTARDSDSKYIQLETVTSLWHRTFSCYTDENEPNQFTLHPQRRFWGCPCILWSDQLWYIMAMHIGCVLLPIIIVAECQYGPGHLHDSNNDHSFDITRLDNSCLKHKCHYWKLYSGVSSHKYFCNLYTVKAMYTGGS